VSEGSKSRTRTFQRHFRTGRRGPNSLFDYINTKAGPAFSGSNGGGTDPKALRLTLQNLGPLYSCFALYLSSRIDLLPAEHCRELSLTPDAATPVSVQQLSRILATELGTRPQQLFAAFDPLPFRSGLLAQHHYATLKTGAQVITVILRPDFYSLQGDAQADFLNSEIVEFLNDQYSLGQAIPEFLASIRQTADFKTTAEALEALSFSNPCSDFLACNRVFPELSGLHMLAYERLPETAGEKADLRPNQAKARRLCHAWLATALFSKSFLVDPVPQNIGGLDAERITFACGEYIQTSQETRTDLWNYLLAVLNDDPDRAAGYLLRQMNTPKAAPNMQEFRSSFRQSAFFGALEPILGTDSNALPQLIFQHWKTALQHGYCPKFPLLSFYRGLFTIARTARIFSCEGDLLREAMEELRGWQLAEKLRSLVDIDRLTGSFDKFATAAIYFPKFLDDALDQMSRNDHSSNSSASHTERNPLVALAIAAVAVLILTIVSHGLNILERILVVLLMLAGLLLLRDHR